MGSQELGFSPEATASWPPPNYVNPPDRGPALFILAIILGVLELITIFTRIYSRLFLTRAFGIDDALTCVAVVLSLVFLVLVVCGDRLYFIGRHIWDIPRDKVHTHFLYSWISQLFYVISSSLIKISILIFYRRLSFKFSKAFTIATWIGISFNLLYLCGFSIVLIIMCQPLGAYWLRYDPTWVSDHSYRCFSETVPIPLSGVCSTIADLYSTVLPMLLVRQLRLSRRQKLGLYGLFGMGFLAVIAGIVRVVYLYRLVTVESDYTWSALWETWIWTILELGIGIFCASASALKPVYRKILGRTGTSYGSRSGITSGVPHARGPEHYRSTEAAKRKSAFLKNAKVSEVDPKGDPEAYSLERTSSGSPSFTVDDDWPLTATCKDHKDSIPEEKYISSVAQQEVSP